MEEQGNPGPDDPDQVGLDPAQHLSNQSGVSESVVGEGSPAHGKNDLFPEFPLLWLPVNLIDAAPRRLRRTIDRQIEAVMRAIECFGFRVPILVRKLPGGQRYQVVDGHTRLVAAQRLGAEVLPCIAVDDLPEVQIRRLALSLNKLQETSEWDPEALRLEIGEIIEISGTLEIPGFSMPELEAVQFGTEGAELEDPADDTTEMNKPGVQAVSQPGDIWHLGDHVITCGSARDGAAVAALLDGQVADAVFSDPPYNVKINGHVRAVSGGFAEFAEASGEMSRRDFVAFLVETLGNTAALLKPGGVLFACIDWRHVGEMTEVVDALGLELLNICVWVKTNPGMGSLYRSQHELVFVARRPGAGHQNSVALGKYGRKRTNVWNYPGATGGTKDADDDFHVHPTVKPIRLVMDALLDVTGPGGLVIDPFLGSGTALLAAERTRRRCIGVEIEPGYVDLAIRRWQKMTGGQAIHVERGVIFDSLAAAGGQGGCDTGEDF